VFAGAYTFSVISSATIVPGVTDTGNHTSAIVSSIGNIQFTGNGSAFSNTSLPNVSAPPAAARVSSPAQAARRAARFFNSEYRNYFSGGGTANYEVRLAASAGASAAA
jgi:hypothetical protein